MVAEIRFGVESIDHIAIPVRDLAINQAFYVDVLGLQFKTTRRNPDGTPRQTYVLAGNNIIGLHLPGVVAGPSLSAAPRIGVGVTRERLEQIQQNLKAANQSYAYFVVRQDGKYLINHRANDSTVHKIVDWTANPAVVSADANGKATNKLSIVVGADKVSFVANGVEVSSLPRAQLDGMGQGTAGIAGVRVNHNLDVHVDGFAVTPAK